MIGKLSGLIDFVDDKSLILDVNGVGYIVSASKHTLSRIGGQGEAVKLFIELIVREDSLTMYGFLSRHEQNWFKLLCSVQGVGAKAGLAILSVASPEKLGVIIASQDKTGLTQADGVGPKLATRILTELKDKASTLAVPVEGLPTDSVITTESMTMPADNKNNESSLDQDALSALVNLGYARADAYSAIMQVKATISDEQDLSALIRLSLKELSQL